MEAVALEGSLEVVVAIEAIDIKALEIGRARPDTVIEAAIEAEDIEEKAARIPTIPAMSDPLVTSRRGTHGTHTTHTCRRGQRRSRPC